MNRAALVALIVAIPTFASAQNCTKGIRCGNTCIATNKTCHISAGSSSSSTVTPPRDTTVASRDSTLPYLAIRLGTIYYLNSPVCGPQKAIRALPRASVVFFKDEIDARKYGLTKSDSEGCSAK